MLGGVAAVGVTSTLVACGNGSGPASSGSSGGGSSNAGPVTVKAANVPVGGGVITDNVVVTQPSAGTYKAFSAVCTHQGCIVAKVEAAKIECACHGSVFSATDGSVLHGPAVRPLPSKSVAVDGQNLTVT
jgi:Rieske Fe-S protein